MNKYKEMINQSYRPGKYLGLVKQILRLSRILHLMARVLPGAYGLRPFLHRLRGVKIGDKVWIGDDVYLDEDYPEALEIHEGAAIATLCTIIAHTKGCGKIVIGKQAAIGGGCVIVCSSGQTLRIGEGAVISVGTPVTHDIPPYIL